MDICYALVVDQTSKKQRPADQSFIGGIPKLPPQLALPVCTLCGSQLTFYFQVSFPRMHRWSGQTLAVFACTRCADGRNYMPVIEFNTFDCQIPPGFLTDYQTNFRFVVYDSASSVPRREYEELIRFKKWRIQKATDRDVDTNKVGGIPNWILDNENPSTYAGSIPMFFVMQIAEHSKFEIVEGAPPQIVFAYVQGQGFVPQELPERHYKLFTGLATFLFGTDDPNVHEIYAICQGEG